MAVSRCRVAYADSEGIEHALEVDTESQYYAVALAAAEFRQRELESREPALMTEFKITCRPQ